MLVGCFILKLNNRIFNLKEENYIYYNISDENKNFLIVVKRFEIINIYLKV